MTDMTARFIGYAIVSEDGMLADASGAIPPAMIVPADQDFFMQGLDRAEAIVHGRHSAEQPTAAYRRRLIVTRGIPALALAPAHAPPKSWLWNPAGCTIAQALSALGVTGGEVAIIGGTDVFGLFLPLYDVFYLSRVPAVVLPGGRPVFPQVPAQSPEDTLAGHGMSPGPARVLDTGRAVTVVAWKRTLR